MRPEFAVHPLNPEAIGKATELGEIFSDCLNRLEQLVPNREISASGIYRSREMSIVLTHLQTAGFWAKRAIAVLPENQVAQQSSMSIEDGNVGLVNTGHIGTVTSAVGSR